MGWVKLGAVVFCLGLAMATFITQPDAAVEDSEPAQLDTGSLTEASLQELLDDLSRDQSRRGGQPNDPGDARCGPETQVYTTPERWRAGEVGLARHRRER